MYTGFMLEHLTLAIKPRSLYGSGRPNHPLPRYYMKEGSQVLAELRGIFFRGVRGHVCHKAGL